MQLSDEQNLLRDSIARFVDDEYEFSRRQKIVAVEPGFSRAHWRRMAELGWLGAALPESHGGLGGGAAEMAIVMEQFGRRLVTSPYLVSVVMSGTALAEAGDEAQKSRWLPAIAEGRIVAFAEGEAPARHDPAFVETAARRDGAGYVLDGAKHLVPFASEAEAFLVSARTGGAQAQSAGISLFLVPAKSPGVSLKPYRTHDGARAADLVLAGVRLGGDTRVGVEGEAFGAIELALDHAAAAMCVEASGAMWAVHDQTLAYMKLRSQFGQTLGSFQALQHRIVDVYIKCQLAQSMAWDAVAALDSADPADRARRVSAAKAHLAGAAMAVGKEGIQLHGGIAMTDDLAIGHYFKRLAAIAHTYGDGEYHMERFRRLSGLGGNIG